MQRPILSESKPNSGAHEAGERGVDALLLHERRREAQDGEQRQVEHEEREEEQKDVRLDELGVAHLLLGSCGLGRIKRLAAGELDDDGNDDRENDGNGCVDYPHAHESGGGVERRGQNSAQHRPEADPKSPDARRGTDLVGSDVLLHGQRTADGDEDERHALDRAGHDEDGAVAREGADERADCHDDGCCEQHRLRPELLGERARGQGQDDAHEGENRHEP